MVRLQETGGKKYSWVLNDDGKCECFPHTEEHQIISGLWEVAEAKPFHDEALMEATKKINRHLASLAEKCPDPDRELCLIEFEGRPFLIWSKTHRDYLIAEDDPRVVAEALGLRYETPSPQATA